MHINRRWYLPSPQESKPFYTLTLNQYGAFIENRLVLNEQLAVVAGLRKDHYDVSRYDSTGWNIGVVYNPIPSIALYGQYALASDPVSSLASIGVDQQAFQLSDGVQLEFGVKGSLWRDRIAWTLAAYDIVKEDLLTPSIANPSISEQVGQQSSRGLEASLAFDETPMTIALITTKQQLPSRSSWDRSRTPYAQELHDEFPDQVASR